MDRIKKAFQTAKKVFQALMGFTMILVTFTVPASATEPPWDLDEPESLLFDTEFERPFFEISEPAATCTINGFPSTSCPHVIWQCPLRYLGDGSVEYLSLGAQGRLWRDVPYNYKLLGVAARDTHCRLKPAPVVAPVVVASEAPEVSFTG